MCLFFGAFLIHSFILCVSHAFLWLLLFFFVLDFPRWLLAKYIFLDCCCLNCIIIFVSNNTFWNIQHQKCLAIARLFEGHCAVFTLDLVFKEERVRKKGSARHRPQMPPITWCFRGLILFGCWCCCCRRMLLLLPKLGDRAFSIHLYAFTTFLFFYFLLKLHGV